MNIRRLKEQDTGKLKSYLAPHKAECMFMCSNLEAAGLEYKGAEFEGEYLGCFDKDAVQEGPLLGVIVHYWNDNVMMHASSQWVLEQLIGCLKSNIKRPVAGVLGPNTQAEPVIKTLGLSGAAFRIDRKEGLYKMELVNLNELSMPSNLEVVSAKEVPWALLVKWIKSYAIEALGACNEAALERQVEEEWTLRLQKNDTWVLLSEGVPVCLSAFNARLTDAVQVGPVWTPPEYRNKGFARALLAYILHQEKHRGTQQAILFTDNPAAIKAYLAIGFKKIGDYRLALLKKPKWI